MVSTHTDLTAAAVHGPCIPHWPNLIENLRSIPPWEWPERIVPWLLRLAGPMGKTYMTQAQSSRPSLGGAAAATKQCPSRAVWEV